MNAQTKQVLKKGATFWICLVVTIGLLVAGFIVPPTGVIDGSVLKGVGILFAFATLAKIPQIIEVAGSIKISKGDMTIEVEDEK